MAGISGRYDPASSLEYQGLLHDLQNWERSLLGDDKKLQATDSGRRKKVLASENEVGNRKRRVPAPEVNKPTSLANNNSFQSRLSGVSDTISLLSGSLAPDDGIPDANSEKELGNEFFKQKKFKEAIDCYSRSIAFSPTAVAFANRAMAYLKIKRFEDAENDCTEALNLDDRYIKAYSRRATARKELGKLKGSFEDAEFALRLEPNNQELKKQYSDVKATYEKKLFEKASEDVKPSKGGIQPVEDLRQDAAENAHDAFPVSSSSQEHQRSPVQDDKQKFLNGSRKLQLNQSLQDITSRAASKAMISSVKNLKPPTTAYQFELSWRRFSDNPQLQESLLKAIPPLSLPQLFKNALSASLLTGIIKCISTFFVSEMELAVSYLENLTRVQRFDMIIMSLPSNDKADLKNIWDNIFCKESDAETLICLRAKYCP